MQQWPRHTHHALGMYWGAFLVHACAQPTPIKLNTHDTIETILSATQGACLFLARQLPWIIMPVLQLTHTMHTHTHAKPTLWMLWHTIYGRSQQGFYQGAWPFQAHRQPSVIMYMHNNNFQNATCRCEALLCCHLAFLLKPFSFHLWNTPGSLCRFSPTIVFIMPS